MPWRVRERECTKEDGTKGEAVLEVLKNGSWRFHSCHDDAVSANILKQELEESE